MPRVPTQVGPSVAPSGGGVVFQNPQGASVDAFGGGTGQALQQAARAGGALDQLDSLVLRQIAEDNEREAKNLDIAFQSRLRVLMHGDGSANNPGFLGLQGENALQARESFQQEVEKARRDIFGRANPRVRQIVEPVAAARVNDVFERSAGHLRQQREVAFDQTMEARIAEAKQEAAINWNDPAKLLESIGVVTSELIDEGERRGRSDEVIQSRIEQERSKIFQGAIEAAIAVDPMTAQTMLVKYAPLMDGDVQSEVSAKLRPFVVLHVAQEAAQEAVARFGHNRAAVEKYLRAKFSGDQETRAVEVATTIIEGYRSDVQEGRAARSHQMAVTNFKQSQEDRAKAEAVDRTTATLAALPRKEATAAAEKLPEDFRIEVLPRLNAFFDNQEANAEKVVQREGLEAGVKARQEGKSITPLVMASNDPAFIKGATVGANLIIDVEEQDQKQALKNAELAATQALNAGKSYEQFAAENPNEYRLVISKDLGADEALRKSFAAKAAGKEFAAASDGKAVAEFRRLPLPERAEFNADAIKHLVTLKEHGDIVKWVEAAKSEMGQVKGNLKTYQDDFNSLVKQWLPDDLRKGWGDSSKETSRQTEVREALQDQRDLWLIERVNAGRVPNAAEMTEFIKQQLTPMYEQAGGIFDPLVNPFVDNLIPQVLVETGSEVALDDIRLEVERVPPKERAHIEGRLTRIGSNAGDVSLIEEAAGQARTIGARVKRLTDQQKKTFVIKYAEIPMEMFDEIERDLALNHRVVLTDPAVMEELAGAVATQDGARYQRLIAPLPKIRE